MDNARKSGARADGVVRWEVGRGNSFSDYYMAEEFAVRLLESGHKVPTIRSYHYNACDDCATVGRCSARSVCWWDATGAEKVM